MTRTEGIASINTNLASLDDERVITVADIVQGNDAASTLPRQLTAKELDLIEQSKEDFRAGRTYSANEVRTCIDAELDRRREQRAKA